MLRYKETYWKYKTGFKVRNFDLTIDNIDPSKTREEQQTRIAKISLVALLSKEQKKSLVTISRRLKRNNTDFYQNTNLHLTLIGFGPLEKKHHEKIQRKIREFVRRKRNKAVSIRLDTIRPGAIYSENKIFGPIRGIGNGTIIAFGNVDKNIDFCNFADQLTSFLLKDKYIRSVLGSKFRRKFPTAWCTLGYYNRKDRFKIGRELANFLKQYHNLEGKFKFSIPEISLVKSNYKNLRYHTVIEKFKV